MAIIQNLASKIRDMRQLQGGAAVQNQSRSVSEGGSSAPVGKSPKAVVEESNSIRRADISYTGWRD